MSPSIIPVSSSSNQSALPHGVPLSESTQTFSLFSSTSEVDQLSIEQVQMTVWSILKKLPPDQQCTVLSNVFDLFLKESTFLTHIPDDFIKLSINGMSHLRKCGRSNVIYSLAKSLGTMRPDQTDSLLPARRMPMGLIEHCVNFFSATAVNQVCTYNKL